MLRVLFKEEEVRCLTLAKKVLFSIKNNSIQKVKLGVGGTTERFPLLSTTISLILCGFF
jgi:hypothetical protein